MRECCKKEAGTKTRAVYATMTLYDNFDNDNDNNNNDKNDNNDNNNNNNNNYHQDRLALRIERQKQK